MPRDIGQEARILLRHPWGWIATGFGGGLSPLAPGTVGSLAAVILFWLSGAAGWSVMAHAAAIGVGFAVGVAASAWTIKALATQDASAIVIDEWVGQWLTLSAAASIWPFSQGAAMEAGFYVAGFGLFRLADILKPWPASLADRRIGGGFGAMFDDLLAAVYSAAALFACGWWLG